MRFCIAVCVLLAFLAPLSAGEKAVKRPITLEDLWKVKRLGKPSISPDGAWVAVDVTSFNMNDNLALLHRWQNAEATHPGQGEFDRPDLVARWQIDRVCLESRRSGFPA
jgi:hypothetical protein